MLGFYWDLICSQCKCDIRGEDIKKWRDAVIVLKNNNIFVYKNESVYTSSIWMSL